MTPQLDELSKITIESFDAITDFFLAIANGTKPIDALRDSLRQLSQSLLKEGIQGALRILLGTVQQSFGATGNGFGINLAARAGGGSMNAGSPYLVGEERP